MADTQSQNNGSSKSPWRPRRVISLVLTGMVAIFLFQNLTAANIDFLFWTLRMPTAILIFFVFLVGLFVGILMQQSRARR